MKRNMGNADRIIRVLFALVVGVLYFSDQISELAATILGVLSVIFLLTGIVGFCPLYAPFKFSTTRKNVVTTAKQA